MVPMIWSLGQSQCDHSEQLLLDTLQFCSSEQRLLKDEFLRQSCEETINNDFQNGYVLKWEENELDETKEESQW